MKNRVGEILLKAGIVSLKQLEEAMTLQKGRKAFLGQILVEMGLCTEQDVAKAISKALHRHVVNLKDALISQQVVQMVPKALAIRHNILPILVQNKTLYVAMANPLDMDVIQQVEFNSGKQVIPLIALPSQLQTAVHKHYTVSEYVGDMLGNVESRDQIILKESDKAKIIIPKGSSEKEVNEIVRLVNMVLAEGIKARATDIHIEPTPEHVKVRYRIDGILTGGIKLPQEVYPLVLSRIKILANMDITDRRISSQDGHIGLTFNQRRIDLRVSTMVTNFGEKIVIRVLDKAARFDDLTRLGLSPEQLRLYHSLIQQPQGLILATGPTGTGKTTTLYALLNAIKDTAKNIVTIEDPIEYELEGITQIQVNPRTGLTFAAGLRSVLRQDPDAILVGEIRDAETASVAIQAAETGHLVLSTLQTTDAISTVNRLFTLDIAPNLIASNLLTVVSQRLIRKICPRCRQEYVPDEQALRSIGLTKSQADWVFYKGVGCKTCRRTGYYGQIGIYEMLVPNEQLRDEIARHAPKQVLKNLAIEAGMKTMLESGVEKIRQGITTIEEVASACTIEQEVPEKAEPISEEKPVVVKPPEPVTAPQTVQVEAAETCEQCGTKLEKRWLMCPVCGKSKTISAQPAEEKGDRILVAEDDPDARKMLQFLLQRQKYQVIQAIDGEEALEKIRIEQPDAVILDINMPKLDGLSVCKAMRADMETMFIPVILLTALDSIESKLQGLSSGADDYMTKPFHPEELLARIDAILRRSDRQQMPTEKKAS